MSNIKEESYDLLEEDNTEASMKQKIRIDFIRKVYGILLFQVILTTIIVYLSITTTFFTTYLFPNFIWVYVSIFGLFFTLLLLLVFDSISRSVPLNYIILTIFTLCESYIVALSTSYYDPLSVLICAGITCGIVLALTLYAIFTKTDVTVCGGTLASLSIILFILTIIGLFFPSLFYQTLVNSCGLFLFSLYLVYDTQLVIGNNSKYLSTDDYIRGAVEIYMDIITIFLKVLWFFGKKKK